MATFKNHHDVHQNRNCINLTGVNNIVLISDIHGYAVTFDKLYNRLIAEGKFDPNTDLLIIAGDIVDRGSNSRQLLDHLFSLKRQLGERLILIIGNHDLDMLNAVLSFNEEDAKWWLKQGRGAVATIRSFGGVNNLKDYVLTNFDLFKAHFYFAYNLLFANGSSMVVSHSPWPYWQRVNEGCLYDAVRKSDDEQALKCANSKPSFGIIQAYGHTAYKNEIRWKTPANNERQPLDNGCSLGGALATITYSASSGIKKEIITQPPEPEDQYNGHGDGLFYLNQFLLSHNKYTLDGMLLDLHQSLCSYMNIALGNMPTSQSKQLWQHLSQATEICQ